ncbi:NAD(P)H-dependent oxidoreductase [Dongia deserti]|uniref:NAD(P)H-dependent oxidoreductase n=1 Tax=Dongia deserti TaxID=2268030 RepID=UPI000E656942|nr:NAD(P)H-dependent oxidoreductase [Dongia deserti]
MDTISRQDTPATAKIGAPLKVFLVLAHPERRSFNGAMADTALETLRGLGHDVAFSDLYRMGWDPVSDRRNFATVKNPDFFKQQMEEDHATESNGFAPDVEAEIAKLEAADLMIWQFPLWWFGLPGILKGWVDKVFAFNRIYGRGRFYEKGLYRGRCALLSLTTGGEGIAAYQPGGFNGDINGILRPIQRGMLQFIGYDVLQPQIVWGPAQMTEEKRTAALTAWRERLTRIAQEEPIVVGQY